MSDVKKPKFCDLKVDRNLLDSKFEGYKLCLDQLRSEYRRLPSNFDPLLPSVNQWSFQHARLFSGHNHLHVNAWTIDQKTRHVYIFLNDGLYSVKTERSKFMPAEMNKISNFELFPTDFANIQDKFNPTLVFPSQELAVIADGCGNLLFCAIGTDQNENWTLIQREENICDGKPFIALDSRIWNSETSNYVDVLLEYVEEMENQEKPMNNETSLFASILEWITFEKAADAGTFVQYRRRRLLCKGNVDYATLSLDGTGLCCLSSKQIQFVYDSLKPVEEVKTEEAQEEPSKLYSWGQTADDICAVFTLDPSVSKENIIWTLKAKSIHLGLKQESAPDQILLEGELYLTVDPEESTWSLLDGRLEVTLQKRDTGRMWPEIVNGDQRGEYVPDPDMVKAVSERLKQFTSDSEMSQSQAKVPFNVQQLEECDMAETDSTYLAWINGETHVPVMEADAGGHQWLFNIRCRPDEPASICLRYDVDGILWRVSLTIPSTDSSQNPNTTESCWSHINTFNAFGYVQAGKPDRKFCTCSPDGSYAVVVDCSRYAYVYWQGTVVDSDLRNRKTGQRVAKVAKQQLVSLSANADEGVYANSMDIFGVTAFDDVLLLLTKDRLVSVFVK